MKNFVKVTLSVCERGVIFYGRCFFYQKWCGVLWLELSLLCRSSFSGETARKRGKERDDGEIEKVGGAPEVILP